MVSSKAWSLNSAVTITSSSSSNGRPSSCAALVLAIEDTHIRKVSSKEKILENLKGKKLFCLNIPHNSKY